MLSKLSVHLKNVIFFKAVIYLLLLVALLALVPVFKDDLTKSTERRDRSFSFLQSATLKLQLLVDFEFKILATNKKYLELVENTGSLGCFYRTNLIKNLESLSIKHGLFKPIEIHITKMLNNDYETKKQSYIKILYHEADIKFSAIDERALLMISRDLFKTLPEGSIILSSNVRKVTTLTPGVIANLSVKNSPGLFDVRMKVQLREVVYEK